MSTRRKIVEGNKYYYLHGQKGYINGIEELNNISELYGQGKGAEKARSINEDDINKITGYNPMATGTGEAYGKGNIYEYGNKVIYSWENENIKYNSKNGEGLSNHTAFKYYDKISNTFKDLGMNETKEITSDYYYYYPETLTTSNVGIGGIDSSSVMYKLVFENSINTNYYWLSSKYSDAREGTIGYGLRVVGGGGRWRV